MLHVLGQAVAPHQEPRVGQREQVRRQQAQAHAPAEGVDAGRRLRGAGVEGLAPEQAADLLAYLQALR